MGWGLRVRFEGNDTELGRGLQHDWRSAGVRATLLTDDTIPIYSGWTRLEALYHFSTTHYYWHGGEIRTLEGILRG